MDKLIVKSLKLQALIGIHPWEHTDKQVLLLDLELTTDISLASNSDDIKDALDYELLSKQLQEFVSTRQFNLIEACAEQLAQFVLAEFPVEACRLSLKKPGALDCAQSVGVVIERSRIYASQIPG